MPRTALLIRCSTEEAERVRIEAQKERRTLSGYVLNAMAGTLLIEHKLLSKLTDYRSMNSVLSRRALITPGPRTALLVRCSIAEAERIREAAKRRELPITHSYCKASSAFGLYRVLLLLNQSSPLLLLRLCSVSPIPRLSSRKYRLYPHVRLLTSPLCRDLGMVAVLLDGTALALPVI
jgi:hypothetical protein